MLEEQTQLIRTHFKPMELVCFAVEGYAYKHEGHIVAPSTFDRSRYLIQSRLNRRVYSVIYSEIESIER